MNHHERARRAEKVLALVRRVRELDAKATRGPWMHGSWLGQCKSEHEHRGPPERGGDCVYEYTFRPYSVDHEGVNWHRCICALPNLTLIHGEPSRPEDSELIAYYRTAAPELASEVERLREERDKIVETAVACIGKACERHTLQTQSEPFAAFNARHETLACHWCEHEEVERLRARVAELEGTP